jgi:hypothetical protein
MMGKTIASASLLEMICHSSYCRLYRMYEYTYTHILSLVMTLTRNCEWLNMFQEGNFDRILLLLVIKQTRHKYHGSLSHAEFMCQNDLG